MRQRTRRVLKWTGAVGCGVMVGWLGLGQFVRLEYIASNCTRVVAGHGMVVVDHQPAYCESIDPPRSYADRPLVQVGQVTVARIPCCRIYWRPGLVSHASGWYLLLPIWIPMIVAAVPTFLLWRADRRRPPGHCQSCGYDLTGNESGKCPECGERA